MMRLNSVDLPTLGRPTMATVGMAVSDMGGVAFATGGSARREAVGRERGAQGSTVGGDDLDRPGQVGDRQPVEEAAVVGQAHIGQQIAVAGRLRGKYASQV